MRGVVLGFLVLSLLAATPLRAQESDKDFLTAYLEDNLSDVGRQVIITGFAGALSSRATVQEMTIADATGVWITLSGVTLDWSRSALLSGRVEISALTAEEIRVDRLPDAGKDALPDPEARGFQLPELPVSVDIGRLAAARIILATPVLGSPVEGSLNASLSLEDGQGQAKLDLIRTDDGPSGQVTLGASYANASRQLEIDLSVSESAGGIASTVLGLPGQPSVDLTVKGAGPTDDFTATVALKTDATDRVTGQFTLRGEGAGGTRFSTDLSGNFAPLLTPEYAAFFGDSVQLTADGVRANSGALVLDRLSFATEAMRLGGQMSIAADGQPLQLELNGDIALPDGSPVLLPLPGADKTRITRATLNLAYDAAKGDDWRLQSDVTHLQRQDITIGNLALNATGTIAPGDTGKLFTAEVQFSATDAAPTDPALARALGTTLSGDVSAQLLERQDYLDVTRLSLVGQGYDLEANGRIGGLDTGLTLTGTASADVEDLARLSGLAGRELRGAARIDMTGEGSPLAGSFDLTAEIDGTSLGIGQTEIDRLIANGAKVKLSARRDETGTKLRDLTVAAASLTATAKGQLSSTQSDLTARVDFRDIGALDAAYRGALTLDADFAGTTQNGRLQLSGTGKDLALGQTELDRLLSGNSTITAELEVKDRVVMLTAARLENPQVSASASGRIDGGNRALTLQARLANLGLLLPDFPGPVTLSGTAADSGDGFQLDLRGKGPGQIDAALSGRLAQGGGSGDLRLTGTAQSGLANVFLRPRAISGPVAFDLRLAGPLRLGSLSGRVSVQGARFSDVELGVSLRDLDLLADVSGGTANLTIGGALATVGRVSAKGDIGLAAPNNADIVITLDRAKLRNPDLFEAETAGSLRLAGPLAGGAQLTGRIDIPTAEIRIPSSGLGSLGTLPEVKHIGDVSAVRETRQRAGLFGSSGVGTGTAASSGGPVYGIDVELVAPSRLFIRGRGLDAELSGRLRLGGTTANVIPSGQFSLIRGRLDILGKRLTLSEASLQLRGDFVPELSIAASNQSDGITSTVRIDGPAGDPVVSFSSSPELPQEEVLARLLFGRGLQNISVLQAAQLANAVATLAGRGGDGIVGRLRKSFGLDDFDVTTDATGSTVLRAGKYISENVYTEVEIGQDGKSEINLNLDVRPGITVTGRVGEDGQTGLGVFVEKDY